MKKFLVAGLFLVLSLTSSFATQGDAVADKAMEYLYVRESNGPNRSKDIDEWNRMAKVPMGSAYCASFISAMHKKVGIIPGPDSAWAPSVVSQNRVSFSQIQRGDCGGIYFPSKGRIGHVFIVDSVDNKYIRPIEGNTSPSASYGSASDRDGDGCFRKLRSVTLMKDSRNKFARWWKKD